MEALGPLHTFHRRIGRTVRARRTARGLSVGELARAAGLSKTIVGRIEAGAGNPSIETLWRISEALAVPLGALLEQDGGPATRVVRYREGDPLGADSGMTAWMVHAEGREHRSELFELDLPAGVEHAGEPHLPGAEELVLCLEGRVTVGPVGEEAELEPGDAVVFAADVAHRYRALADARALCLMLYPEGSAR